jgi:hypothetical protein
MLCYFSSAPSEPPTSVDEASQLLKVTEFRALVDEQGLAWRYHSDGEFKNLLREHLQRILTREFAGRRPPLDRNLAALLDMERERCQAADVSFVTPNLLVALLGARTGAGRRIFDRAVPGAAEALLSNLRRYAPLDETGAVLPFEDFDWYDRADVQAARRRAQMERARVIDARHLLLGFLETAGETRAALRRTLGEEGFDRLVRTTEVSDRATGTPGIGDFLVISPPQSGE